MTAPISWYGPGLRAAMQGEVNWPSDIVKLLLCSASYTPDLDADAHYSDLVNEVTGTGYPAGGWALTSKTSAYSTGSHAEVLDAADLTTGNVTVAARYGVIYKDTGTGSTSPLLGLVDLGGVLSPSAQPIVVTWDAAGILEVTR